MDCYVADGYVWFEDMPVAKINDAIPPSLVDRFATWVKQEAVDPDTWATFQAWAREEGYDA